jgi:hypothetical protein
MADRQPDGTIATSGVGAHAQASGVESLIFSFYRGKGLTTKALTPIAARSECEAGALRLSESPDVGMSRARAAWRDSGCSQGASAPGVVGASPE